MSSFEYKVAEARKQNTRIFGMHAAEMISRDQALKALHFIHTETRQRFSIPDHHFEEITTRVAKESWGLAELADKVTLQAMASAICRHLGMVAPVTREG